MVSEARPGGSTSRVVVLAGGWSEEREVSKASGRAVAAALRSLGYEVVEIDPAYVDFATFPWESVRACFIALHGGCGEDGTIQALLQQRKVPFTGSPPEACRLAISKHLSKERFRAVGLRTPPWFVCMPETSWYEVRQQAGRIGYPLIVKPDRQGSSIGVAVAYTSADLEAAVQQALQYDQVILIERYIAGRELTVALLGDSPLPPVEIAYCGDCYDYHAKYEAADTRYIVPANLSEELAIEVSAAACTAAAVLGCQGLSRVDLRIDEGGRAWVLEVNTVPGLTPRSLAPKAAAAVGIDFGTLCAWMLEEAIERFQQRAETSAPHFRSLTRDRLRRRSARSGW